MTDTKEKHARKKEWKVVKWGLGRFEIEDGVVTVAVLNDNCDAETYAHLIVSAVNSHADLLDAAKAVVQFGNDSPDLVMRYASVRRIVNHAYNAIVKAEPEGGAQ